MAQSGDGNGKLQLEWVRQEEEMIFISDINYVLIVAWRRGQCGNL